MANNADRKPLFSRESDEPDDAAGPDPLMELSLIAGLEDAPASRGRQDDRATETPPGARGAQIDLEEALEAELAPTSAAEPSDEMVKTRSSAPEGDGEDARTTDIPAFLSTRVDDKDDFETAADVTDETVETELPAVETDMVEGAAPAERDPLAEYLADEEASLAATAPDEQSDDDARVAEGDAPLSSERAAPPQRDADAPAQPATLEDELAAMLGGGPAAADSAEDMATETAPDNSEPDDLEPLSTATVSALSVDDDTRPAHDAVASIEDATGPAPSADAADFQSSGPGDEEQTEQIDAPHAEDFDPTEEPADQAPDQIEEPRPVFSRATPVAAVPIWEQRDASDDTVEPTDEIDLQANFNAVFDDELTQSVRPPAQRTDDAERVLPEAAHAPAQGANGETRWDSGPDASEQVDPVDELAAIMGLERADDRDTSFVAASHSANQHRSFDDMEADFRMALEQELPDIDASEQDETRPVAAQQSAPAGLAAAPALETVDMSAFEGVAPAEFDVPELEQHAEAGLDDAAFADLEDELASALDDDAYERPRPAATQSPAESEFDAAQVEAELARDMEFVGHDMNAPRDGDGADASGPGDAGRQGLDDEPQARSGRRAMMVGLIVAGLAVAGIGGVLALVGGEGAVDEGPVLVEADPEPVKVEPDDPGGTTVPNQDRAVFADGEGATPQQQNLVSTAEEPVDIASAPVDGLPSAVAAGEKAEDRLTAGGTETQAEPGVVPITPRRVRTLIVRPDGTLEERAPEPASETVAETTSEPAPSEPASAPEPAAAEVAEANDAIVDEPETVAGLPVAPREIEVVDDVATPVGPSGPEAAEAETTEPAAQAVETAAVADTGEGDNATAGADQTAPVVVRRVQTTTATPASIADRPADQPVNVVNRQQRAAPVQTASAPAASSPTVPTVTNGSTGGFTVQLAALPSEESARVTATRLSEQYGSLIGGRSMTIQRAVIDGRGTFYRVRVAADGSSDANDLCNRIKASGGNCFVAR